MEEPLRLKEDMIERVARVLFPSVCPFAGVGCCQDPDFDRCRECAEDVRGIARDAIAAMREPTAAMRQHVVDNFDLESVTIVEEWQAMVDAALQAEGGS